MNRIELKPVLLALLVAVCWHSHLDSQGGGSNRTRRVEVISGREVAAGEVLVRFTRPVQGPERALLEEQLDIQQSSELPLNLRRIRSRTFDVETLRAALRSHPAVAYTEPNYIVRTAAVPNDPGFTQLWRLLNTGQTINGQPGIAGADIQVERAWDITTGSSDTVVGLLDTGVDYTHPDLAGNIWRAPAPFQVTIGESRIVCPAGAYGFNAITNACDPMDDNNHGTHAAGVIGALGNNGLGVTGVNWTTRILPVKFLDATGTGTVADAINALEFLIQTKNGFAASGGARIRVLSNSWGGAQFSQALLDQIERAAANGMLFVAAAGNTSSSSDSFPTYPASYQASNVVTVAASDNVDRLASFSDYGSTVHLAAPGVGVLSTTPRNSYSVLSGTSMAAAHVAGAAALILSKCALETPALKAVILESVDALGSLAGWVATSGRLNVDRALRLCSSADAGGALSEMPAAPPAPAAVPGANDTVGILAIDDAVVNLPFNNGAGTTATDVSGNSNHGTLQNGPVWVNGRSNGGLSFDGSNDAVVINSSPSLNGITSSVTVAAWVFRNANQSSWRSILSRQAGSETAEHYYLGFNDNAFKWGVNTTAGYSNFTIGGPAAVGQWLHLVGTYDGTTVRLYVNGVEHFSAPHSGTFAADTTRVVVGSSHNDAAGTPSEGFNGVIGEMRLYGRALTAQEVNDLFVATGTSTNLPPTVTITSPGGGPVSGTVNYTASASDSDGSVLGVHFRIDGVISAVEDTSSPYAADVDTVLYSDGNHTLTAVARDDVGNVTISSPVTVTFNNNKSRVMPLGDSLTYGILSNDNPDNELGGYRKYLWETARANGITTIDFVGSLSSGGLTMDRDHEGHPGWTVTQIAGSINAWLAAHQPDSILICIGTNDLNEIGATPAVVLSRLSSLLDQIHSVRPSATLLVANLPGVSANNQFPGITTQEVNDFNAGVPGLVNSRIGQGWAISFVDLFGQSGLDRAATSADFSPDGLHPSLAGYAKLANIWYSALFSVPPPVGEFVLDTFTGSAGTPLDAHIGEVGAGWATQTGSDTGFVLSDSGRIRNALADPNPVREVVHYASGVPATSEYDVEAILRVVTLTQYVGIGGRANPASRTLYYVYYDFLNQLWELRKLVDGTAVSLGTFGQVLTPGTDYTVRLALRSGSQAAFVNGAQVISASDTDPALSAPGRVAVVGFGSVTDTTGLHIDRISATGFQAPPDTEDPTVPTGLTATAVSSTRIALSWTASQDNVGVTGYRVYRNGALVGTAAGRSHTDTGLVANTAYTYRVTAIDAVPNESGQSDVAGATTLAPAGVDVGAVFNLTLDAGAGLTAADSSGNGNQGTLVNGATWTAGTAFGAVSFDGSNDAIVVPASATINGVTTSVTVAAWVYRNGAQPSWVSVLSRQLGTGAAEQYYLGFESNQYRWVVNTAAAGYSNTTLGGAAPVGQWVHLVGTYDGTTVRLYVDGAEAFATAHTGSFISDAPGVVIGGAHNDGTGTVTEGLAGKVDEVRLYGRALSASEVVALYNATAGSSADPLPTSEPGQFVVDTFSLGAAGADLTTRAGEVGATWAPIPGSGTGWVLSAEGRARLAAAGAVTTYYASGVPATADYDVEAVIRVLSATSFAGVAARTNPGSAMTMYTVYYNPAPPAPNAPRWELHKVVDGTTDLVLGSFTQTLTAGQVSRLRLAVRGTTPTTLAVYVDDLVTPKITYTDTIAPLTAAGRAAIIGLAADAAPTTGLHLTSVTAAVAQAPPDTEDPTVPTGLTATAVSSTRIALSWTASQDNVGVTGYRVYRNGALVGTAAGRSHTDTGLVANTAYTYRMTAIDAVPNESGQSDVAGATTLAPAGVDVGAVFNLTLDAGAGLTAADSSGNGNQGTLVNGATWTAGTAFGAVSFDGSNDAIVVPASATINGVTTSVTVAAWVYRNGAQPSWVSVLSRQLGTGAAEQYYLGFESNQYRWVVNTAAAGYSNTTLGGAAPVGQWVHLVGTYDGTTVRLYVDGAEAFATAHTGSFISDAPGVVIGGAHNDGTGTVTEGLAGKVDEVRLYGRALSASEVVALYNATAGSSADPLPTSEPGQFVVDTFSLGAAGADLTTRAGEVGATWAPIPGSGTGWVLSAEGRARLATANVVATYYASGVPATADYDVEAVIRVLSATSFAGVAARTNPGSAMTMYTVYYHPGAGRWELHKVVNGGGPENDVVVGTPFVQTLTPGQVYRLRLAVRGTTPTTLAVYVDDLVTPKITYTDTIAPLTAAGRAAIIGLAADAAPTTGLHLTSVTAAVDSD